LSERPEAPIVVSLAVEDRDLRARLTELLFDLPGVRLAEPGEQADVAIVPAPVSASADGEQALTQRELEVLTLIAEGASNKVIARRLGISVNTAKFHVSSLLDKLDATGRTDAVAHAARLGVIHL
jgi:DNA-binding NarL/FixJ family response regulator